MRRLPGVLPAAAAANALFFTIIGVSALTASIVVLIVTIAGLLFAWTRGLFAPGSGEIRQ